MDKQRDAMTGIYDGTQNERDVYVESSDSDDDECERGEDAAMEVEDAEGAGAAMEMEGQESDEEPAEPEEGAGDIPEMAIDAGAQLELPIGFDVPPGWDVVAVEVP